jgi:hypothetical protein
LIVPVGRRPGQIQGRYSRETQRKTGETRGRESLLRAMIEIEPLVEKSSSHFKSK